MARGPMRQVCQTCRDGDEFVDIEIEGPGLWRYSCSSPAHGDSSYFWLSTGRSPLDGAGHDGLSEQLGIYDALLRCFSARSEEHTSELQSLMRISYAVFCLKK